MRLVQLCLLALAVVVLLLAAINFFDLTGLIFWRAGVAILLLDAVLILLWPNKPRT